MMSSVLKRGEHMSGSVRALAVLSCVALELWPTCVAAQTTTRVSVSSSGAQGAGSNYQPAISRNGSTIAFSSTAALVANDTNGQSDIYVHDLLSHQTTRVSVSSTGVQANGGSGELALSYDGRYVVFGSAATNLVPGDTNGTWDIFVFDRQTNQISRESISTAGTQANGDSGNPSISGNGRYVVFESAATNLVPADTGGFWDIFLRDRQTGATTRLSVSSGGGQANFNSFNPAVSSDGRLVAFESAANNLVVGDTNAQWDVFIRDVLTTQTTRASLAPGGSQANGNSGAASLSDDGRWLAYYSSATNLVTGDTNGVLDIFITDLLSGQTERVSTSTTATQSNAQSDSPHLSSDGRYVIFESSATNLVSGDTNGALDIFLKDRETGTTSRLSVATDGTQGNGDAVAFNGPRISGDGRLAALASSANNLVVGDTNGTSDIFVRDRGPDSSLSPVDHLSFSPVSSPQLVGSPFSVTLTARDAAEAVVFADFDVQLSSSFGHVTPNRVRFVNGSVSLQLVLDSPGLGSVLSALGGGATGESNVFDSVGSPNLTAALAGVVVSGGSALSLGDKNGLDHNATPVPGATVTLWSAATGNDARTTDANGAYSFMGKPCDTYNLIATAGQTTTPGLSVRLSCGSTTTADLILEGCPSGVTPILLVPGIAGSTIPGAWIAPQLPARSPDSFSGAEWGPWSDNTLFNQAAGLHDPFGAAGWRNLASALRTANPALSVGCSIIPVPYDWRLPVDEAVRKYLIPAIDWAKLITGSPKVAIVTHSMGGLLARGYIQSDAYSARNDVEKLAMVGPPNLGSATAYLMWQGGEPFAADRIAFNLLSDWYSRLRHVATEGFYTETTQMLSRNMRGRWIAIDPNATYGPWSRTDVADLYHDSVESLLHLEPTWDVLIPRGELACPAMNGVLRTNSWLDVRNVPSVTRSRMVQEDNPDPAKVRTKIFAGTGYDTILYLPSGAASCTAALFPDGKPDAVPSADVSRLQHTLGDGTVTLISAHGGLGPDALGAQVSYFSPQKAGEHSGLINTYRCEVLHFLLGPSASCTPENLGSQLGSQPDVAASGTLSVAVYGRPQPYLVAPSSAASGINPANGARESGIPGSSVAVLSESGVVSVENPETGTYQVHLSSQFAEQYTLQVTYVTAGASEVQEMMGFNSDPDGIQFTFDPMANPRLSVNHSPSPPGDVRANAVGVGERYAELSWIPSNDSQVVGYKIYGRPDASPTLMQIGSATGASFATGEHWADSQAWPVRVYAVSAIYVDGSESFLSAFVLNDDRDHDGLTDIAEGPAGSSPDNPDSDGDGLRDGAEMARGTSPLVRDTDGDSYSDWEEVNFDTDPLDPVSFGLFKNGFEQGNTGAWAGTSP